MGNKNIVRKSKLLSKILRHSPEIIHLQLDESGWTNVEVLLENIRKYTKTNISFDELEYIVANNDKKRFAFNTDKKKIRANQGHSIEVALGYAPVKPPDILYHGTAIHNLKTIRQKGLLKMKRHHVHLSPDKQTARKVGVRHGKVVILSVKAFEMHQNGYEFYCSTNGVWLTDHVKPEFLVF